MARAARSQRFAAELARWLNALRRRERGATADTYERPVSAFLGVTRGQLTPASIARYLEHLDESGIGKATKARNISAVRSFLSHCMQVRLIPWHPIAALGLERPKQIKSDPGKRTMLTSELEAVYAASSRLGEREHAIVWLLATTGLRVSEVCKSRWSDLRLDEVTGRVALHVESLKGGESREVEVVPGLFGLLAKLHGSERLSNRDERPLIAHGGYFYTRSGVHRLLTRVLTEAGIDHESRNISALWFRHSTFSLEARGQATAYQIRKQAGHQRIETSQHYVDLGRGLLDSPTHLLPDFLLGEGYSKPQA
jgi:integrase